MKAVKYTDPDGKKVEYDDSGNLVMGSLNYDEWSNCEIRGYSRKKPPNFERDFKNIVGFSVDDAVNWYNSAGFGSQISKYTIWMLFNDKEKARELLMENYSIHHDLREYLNSGRGDIQTPGEAQSQMWSKVGIGSNMYHSPFENEKWISPDGHRERIFNIWNGRKETRIRYVGTFNFYDPNTNPYGHWIVDMLPYYYWGN